ncbi:MAG: fused MFS/spermidine synthase [Anaerolinea sp.]|nr:fused MFS/spermidine synthase [Anaerolinea sp.]
MTDTLDRPDAPVFAVSSQEAGNGPQAPAWTWHPYAIVFVSNACIMVLELTAGRIVAPHVGVSLYTWTSIIGIVLAGISLGNYIGGRLADRRGSRRLLGFLFLLAGLTSFGVLAVDVIGNRLPAGWPVIGQIVALVTVLFFAPSLVLGTISPVVAKLAVRDLATTGATVGKIYAAGTVGSIVGTFATGFVLISWFGTTAIVWGVALVLIGMGLIFLGAGRRRALVAAALVVALGLAGAQAAGWLASRCTLETNYFCIRVREEQRDGRPVRVLVLDRLVHSYSSLEDPTLLVYGYEQLYAQLVRYQAQAGGDPSALFIGGGGYTFPRAMEALYPDSAIDVIEIDPGVTQVAHDLLGLSRDTRIRSFNEDARLVMQRPPDQRYDLIMGDAFNDFSVPYHLTTHEFNRRVRAWLDEDGLYLVNIIDGPTANFLRAYTRTLRESFDYVYLAPTQAAWRETPRSTFVVIASDTPLDMERLAASAAADSSRTIESLLLSDQQLDSLLAEGRQTLLTDRYAPVDQLLAPAFRNYLPASSAPASTTPTAPRPALPQVQGS